jgi:hypothetical protein
VFLSTIKRLPLRSALRTVFGPDCPKAGGGRLRVVPERMGRMYFV